MREEHTTGKTHVCSICSVPFKRPSQLKNHLQKQHGTINSVFSGPSNMVSTSKTIDTSTLSADLVDGNSVTTLYYSSSPAEVFAVQQQLQSSDATAKEDDSSVRQCQTSQSSWRNLDTSKPANTNTGNQTAVGSSVSEVYDNGLTVSDNSATAAPQTLDCLHNSCSASESDVLFSHECPDSLPLPIPSLAEDSIAGVIAISNDAGLSMEQDCTVSPINRPDITEATYLPWHVQFAESMCAAAVPLAGDQLQAVVSVWSSLVNDMTTLMTHASMSAHRQHCPALFDVVRKLSTVVESHLQILQPAGIGECHK